MMQSDTQRHIHSGVHYIRFLEQCAIYRKVETYFEIGVNLGKSLGKIHARCIGVDPQFVLRGDVMGRKPELLLFQTTSDEFFRNHDISHYFDGGLDLAFLDGMHLFEFLLRDFINTERHMKAGGLIFLHDCLPINAEMAERVRSPSQRADVELRSYWTGDVWKLVPILAEYRPDLEVLLIDCAPTGLVAVRNFGSGVGTLAERYDEIVAKYTDIDLEGSAFTDFHERFPTMNAEDAKAALSVAAGS